MGANPAPPGWVFSRGPVGNEVARSAARPSDSAPDDVASNAFQQRSARDTIRSGEAPGGRLVVHSSDNSGEAMKMDPNPQQPKIDTTPAISRPGEPDANPTPVGVIETDSFCDACGFNLHTQKVWRDPRLGFLVCRCPECGQHKPAAERTTAASAWLRRLGILGLLIWGVIGVSFVIGVFMFGLVLHPMAEEGLTYENYETVDGRLLEPDYSSASAGNAFGYSFAYVNPTDRLKPSVPPSEVLRRRRLNPWLGGALPLGEPPESRDHLVGGQLMGTVVAALLVAAAWFTCAMMLGTASWFWRRRRRWLWLVIPLLSSGVVSAAMLMQRRLENDPKTFRLPVEDLTAPWLNVGVTAASILIMAAGLWASLPIARLLASIFVPPKARQTLAFLWHCEGKTMPAPRVSM